MINDLYFWGSVLVAGGVFWSLPETLRYKFLALASFGTIFVYDAFSAVCLSVFALGLYLSLPFIAKGDKSAAMFLGAWITAIVGFVAWFKAQPLLAIPTGKAETMADALIPLGASYYSFKMIHVAIDTYRRRMFSTPSPIFFTYLFIFTAFVAGPIQRLELFEAGRRSDINPDQVFRSVLRVSIGILKVTSLTALLLYAREQITGLPAITIDDLIFASPLAVWTVLVCAYLLAYLNLGGYTDIAIGTSRLFGLEIQDNFNWPIVARNLSDFWRRWHITLSRWCQDYIYIPILAWSRYPLLALVLSFQVMGLWHVFSLNRITWGLWHAGGVFAFMLWARLARRWPASGRPGWLYWPRFLIAWAITQSFVAVSWIFVIDEYGQSPMAPFQVIARAFGF